MTVSATQARQIYACNGATTVRSVPFKIEDETHLSVVRKTISDGTLLTLTLNSGGANGYTVQNVGAANAQFTTVTAWSNLYQLMVKRAVPLSQANDYVDNDSFPAATLEQTVDLIVEQLQSLTDRADRALYADDFTPLNTYNFTFPIPIDGGTIVWNSGSAKWVSTTSSLATLQAQAALLAGIAADITAVAAIGANVTTVAGDTANINTVAGSISNVNTVAGNMANLATLIANFANINTVAGISGNVTTVAGIATQITNLGALTTEISNLNTIRANITTVAGISTAVSTVAGISTAVSGVNTIAAAVSGVNTIAANVTTVAGIGANVTTVAGISGNVTTVAGISGNVTTVAGISANVTTVAGVSGNVTTVATNIANVNTVAGISANVTTVAGAAANIATIVANLTTITNAANNIPKANLSATTDPGVGNDSSQGYQAGSEWVNTTGGKVWFCTSAAVGAANWVNATATSGTFAGLSDVALSGLADLDFIQYTLGTTKYRNRSVANVKTDLSLNNVTNVAQMPLTYLDTDTTLAANSDAKVASQKAIKTYVDAIVAGLDMKPAARVVATTNQTGTYLNGSSGVGATFTYTATGADVIDSVTLALNDYVMLTGQTSAFQNGLYKVTLAGTGGVAGILTRAVEYDTSSEIFEGTYVVVEEGTSYKGTLWILTTSGAVTVGTTSLTFTQLAVTSLAASALTGNTLASSVVTSSLTAVGTITTGVWNGTIITSAYGGTGNGFTKFSGPASTEKTFTLPNATCNILTDNALVTIAQGGTGANALTNHGVVTAGASALTTVAPGTSGNVLTSNGTDWTSAAAASGGATLALSTGTAAINLDATYNGKSVELTGSTSRTFTFTAAATLGAAWACIIANNSTAELTLDPNASETIDGLTTFKMYQGEKRLVMCNATGFISFVLKPFYLTVAQAASPFTFTKPPGYLSFRVRCGGAGGSGANGSTQTWKGGGGGGGSCVEAHLAASKFSATETVTVGAGGVAVTGSNSAGNVGNNTTVTAGSITITAYGGGPGGVGGGSNAQGAGGGGYNGVGLVTGVGGGPAASAAAVDNGGFGGAGGGLSVAGANAVFGGGGGGGGNTGAGACFAGGTSVYGGGGGSGGSSTGTLTAGGVSQFGGAGGAGGNGTNNGGNGTAGTDGYGGGGGGGTSANANSSGTGGNGSAAIWGIA